MSDNKMVTLVPINPDDPKGETLKPLSFWEYCQTLPRNGGWKLVVKGKKNGARSADDKNGDSEPTS